ncbi:MAG: chemotaxis protein CheC [Bacillota bacterium]|nr:chemotaxis protein CheC [Bacillota bacterium]
MMDYNKLSDLQLDALKEIGNVGAGNAATALSQLLQKKIDMEVPRVKVMPTTDIPDAVGGSELLVAGVYLRVESTAPSNILFVLPIENAQKLVNALMGKEEHEDIDEMGHSALMEIGNILAGSYLNSLSMFTSLAFAPSVPALAIDMSGAILTSVIFNLGEVADYTMVIETKFMEDEADVSGYFFLLPEPDSLQTILVALGVSS